MECSAGARHYSDAFVDRARPSRARPHARPDSLADLGEGASTAVRQARAQALLLDALRRLPIDTQPLLELRYWEELKSEELSQMFEVESPTIRTRLHRARQQLKDEIQKLEVDPSLRSEALGGFETWARELRGQR